MSVGRVQMNFLHLLSSEAVQHVTIHCLNISIWRSSPDLPPSQEAVRFRAWSGEMIEVGGDLEPYVLEDSCWVCSKLDVLHNVPVSPSLISLATTIPREMLY